MTATYGLAYMLKSFWRQTLYNLMVLHVLGTKDEAKDVVLKCTTGISTIKSFNRLCHENHYLQELALALSQAALEAAHPIFDPIINCH